MVSHTSYGGNYTEAEIKRALSYRNYTPDISYRFDLLDRREIKIGEVDVTGGEVKFSYLASIKRTATFNITKSEGQDIDYLNDKIRPVFILHMKNGGWVEFPLGVFILETSEEDIKGNITTRRVSGYDVTMVLEQDKFTGSLYTIDAGTNYVSAIVKIIQEAGITKINIEPSDVTIKTTKVFDKENSKRNIVNQLLQEINYDSIWSDENGYLKSSPYILPGEKTVDHVYFTSQKVRIKAEATRTLDASNAYNVFERYVYKYDGDNQEYLYSVKTNDNPSSKISTINRGRRIVSSEPLEDISSQEALDAQVERILAESTQAYEKFSLVTPVSPLHSHADNIHLYIDEFMDVPAFYSETIWRLPLDVSKEMSHEIRRIVEI